MRAESVAKSIKMLEAILEGRTHTAVARESGLSRSAVEQRVKAPARELQIIVGVEEVDEDGLLTLGSIRARKENYLEALEHYHRQAGQDLRHVDRTLAQFPRNSPRRREGARHQVVPGDSGSAPDKSSAHLKHECVLCGGVALPTASLALGVPPDLATFQLGAMISVPRRFHTAWDPARARPPPASS